MELKRPVKVERWIQSRVQRGTERWRKPARIEEGSASPISAHLGESITTSFLSSPHLPRHLYRVFLIIFCSSSERLLIWWESFLPEKVRALVKPNADRFSVFRFLFNCKQKVLREKVHYE